MAAFYSMFAGFEVQPHDLIGLLYHKSRILSSCFRKIIQISKYGSMIPEEEYSFVFSEQDARARVVNRVTVQRIRARNDLH